MEAVTGERLCTPAHAESSDRQFLNLREHNTSPGYSRQSFNSLRSCSLLQCISLLRYSIKPSHIIEQVPLKRLHHFRMTAQEIPTPSLYEELHLLIRTQGSLLKQNPAKSLEIGRRNIVALIIRIMTTQRLSPFSQFNLALSPRGDWTSLGSLKRPRKSAFCCRLTNI